VNNYFSTNWGAMTLQDWLGLIVTIVVFLLMIGLYVYVFHPANKDKLEAQRYIPLDEHFIEDDHDDLQAKNHTKKGAEERK
jgi:cytochrome c oxidase cbb3-type subunit 4